MKAVMNELSELKQRFFLFLLSPFFPVHILSSGYIKTQLATEILTDYVVSSGFLNCQFHLGIVKCKTFIFSVNYRNPYI